MKTIADFERDAESPCGRTLKDLRRAFEETGVEFTNGGGPEVTLKKGHAQ